MKKSKLIPSLIFITLLGGALTVFSILYLDTFKVGYLFKHSRIFKTLAVCAAVALTVISIILMSQGKQVAYKSLISASILILFMLALFYALEKSGFLDRVTSREQLQEYISGFGNLGRLVFVFIQFLQVAVIPIPGIITIYAGATLFGPWMGGLLSFIGIMIGSLVAFWIGRKLGYKAASWLVGEDDLKKWMKNLKGKDKIILTFMFLLPLFPDDILCFVAGLSSMDTSYFLIMITITRFLSISATTLSVYGYLIPYNTWWGIIIWMIVFAACIWLFIIIYKRGDDLQKYLNKRKKAKKKSKESR